MFICEMLYITCFCLYEYKCGHINVLSKMQVWMSIFHIINLKKKKKIHGHRDPGFFFNKKLILDYYFCLKVRSCVFISNFHLLLPRDIKLYH